MLIICHVPPIHPVELRAIVYVMMGGYSIVQPKLIDYLSTPPSIPYNYNPIKHTYSRSYPPLFRPTASTKYISICNNQEKTSTIRSHSGLMTAPKNSSTKTISSVRKLSKEQRLLCSYLPIISCSISKSMERMNSLLWASRSPIRMQNKMKA